MVIFGTILMRILLNVKIAGYCKSNKQMGRACASRISMKPRKRQGRTEAQRGGGGLDKSKFVAKIWGRRVRQKTPVGKKKYPLKTVALAVKM